ncbi:ImmA/IrrE family metallo-endopeptidase [Nodosilinea sp. PGN35]|uniref:ImmA/IrrE family metallo-endopeptidase n=1 Tax=Nodosilinea sp. PGN35 TaxID=3020489 RepID=UPI0023B2A000|nr:ImmA/IrrE family metallo-endopeptidase [Nodosilinea sp. TSF1-S3]MDF0369632.1 ImmA/IrrE family metallo-endopeptidase [Nodosilinea sp. TSF1-S3]
MAIRRKHIRNLVEQLLEDHRIEVAPVPIEEVAPSLGIRVQYEPAEDELSGFLLRDLSRQKAIIGVNDRHSKNRQRFTIAHELGHYLLHEQEKLHVDRRFQIQLRDGNSSKGESEEEKEANLFAAELLMPVSFIRQDLAEVEGLDLEDDATVSGLAEKYSVSTQAMTFRLAYLGYLQL